MWSDIKYVYELHKKLIFFLGFAYGATIVFPAFGPALSVAVGNNMPLMSTVAFLCYTISFLFPANPKADSRIRPKNVFVAILVLSPGILYFDTLSLPFQWGLLILFSLFTAQLGSAWTQYFRLMVINEHRGKVAALSIGLTFLILYICTIIIDYAPVRFALLLPVLLVLYSAKKNLYDFYETDLPDFPSQHKGDTGQNHYALYILFVIIYISGGFTYAGIFPKFLPYAFISKYYNVQPLFFTVLFAGFIADKIGRKTMLYIGFAMVGLSFTTFMMPASYTSYLLTQTFTQIGWGFVNTYVWTVSADLSSYYGKRTIAARGVSCMLFGTVLGAIVAHFFNQAQFTLDIIYGAATLIPIFIGLILANFIPETLKYGTSNLSDSNLINSIDTQLEKDLLDQQNMVLEPLTNREKEIALLLLDNLTRNEICSTLNISINTLKKTHIRHIYKKNLV